MSPFALPVPVIFVKPLARLNLRNSDSVSVNVVALTGWVASNRPETKVVSTSVHTDLRPNLLILKNLDMFANPIKSKFAMNSQLICEISYRRIIELFGGRTSNSQG